MFRHHHRHWSFWRTKEVNEMYISVFFMNLAETLISIFVPIYLYTLGYSVVAIIGFYLLVHGWFVLLAYPAAQFVSRVGAKHAILVSVPFLVVYYLGLRWLDDSSFLFYILPFFLAIHALLYNFGFELNFIEHTDHQRFGKTLSVLQITAVAAGAISPFLSGILITKFSFSAVFILGSLLLAGSVVPLFSTPDRHGEIDFSWKDLVAYVKKPKHHGFISSFSGYAVESSIGRVVWPIFLFLMLAGIEQVGIVATFSTLITIVVLWSVGKLTDKYSPRTLLRLGTWFYVAGWATTILADSTVKLFFIESYRKVFERFLLVPWSTIFYRASYKEKYYQAIVARDIIFNIVRLIVLPFLMLVFFINWHPFVITFLLASLASVLYASCSKLMPEK